MSLKENESISALVLCGFRSMPHKIKIHIQPLADNTEETKVIWLNEKQNTNNIEYLKANKTNNLFLNLFIMLILAIKESLTKDYDIIVAVSLIPYGLFALIAKFFSGIPAHLGIIGGDLDVHAKGKFSGFIEWVFHRFDSIHVSGYKSVDKLTNHGIPKESIFTVSKPPAKSSYFEKSIVKDPTYDILWLGRVSHEKRPLMFVDILAELKNRSISFKAALVGSGPLDCKVKRKIEKENLDEFIDMPGWTNNPLEYYEQSKIYVMTSSREMLPLSMTEAMCVGCVPVVPPLGDIPELVDNGKNGILLEDASVKQYANEIEFLLKNEKLLKQKSQKAKKVQERFSDKRLNEEWGRIFKYVGII